MTNVLVIMADDMRVDHLPYMANVRRLIAEPGRTFTDARCNVALCQPNRVGYFTGQLSLHHGELGAGISGAEWGDHDRALASWLEAAGVRCGHFGKYINYWDSVFISGLDAPSGWAAWHQLLVGPSAAEYPVHVGTETVTVTGQYESAYLSEQVRAFFDGPGPWFANVAPQLPHSPFAPHPDFLHAWAHEECRIVPLADASAKPPWIRDLSPLDAAERAVVQQDFRGRLRELSAVDRLVGELVTDLDERGVLDETIVIFTSDNGVHQGDQRRRGDGTKAGPYDVGLRVPMVVRGPGFEPGPAVTVPVYPTQDLAATLVEVNDAEPSFEHQAGRSLRELATNPGAHRQRVLLHEIGPEGYDETGDGITTGPDHDIGYLKLFRFPSVRSGWAPGQPAIYEMYDLAADPDELTNLGAVAAKRAVRDQLEALLDAELAR
jgi:arylsulfatase A-like enzyme